MHTRKRTTLAALCLRGSLVAAAVPALLLAGGGTAHASSLDIDLDPWPGGLTVHIENQGQESTWCTYTADWYQSPRFHLQARQTYDLVIVPSVPEFRNWDIAVKCDNGQSLRQKVFY